MASAKKIVVFPLLPSRNPRKERMSLVIRLFVLMAQPFHSPFRPKPYRASSNSSLIRANKRTWRRPRASTACLASFDEHRAARGLGAAEPQIARIETRDVEGRIALGPDLVGHDGDRRRVGIDDRAAVDPEVLCREVRHAVERQPGARISAAAHVGPQHA